MMVLLSYDSGVCWIPKLAFSTKLLLIEIPVKIPFDVPSEPVPVPINSPVFSHLLGKETLGAALPIVPSVVLKTTEYVADGRF